MNAIFALVLVLGVCSAKEIRIDADDQNISYTGRVQYLSSGFVSFDWSGIEIHLEFNIDNEAGIYALLSDNGNAYNVFLDGNKNLVNISQSFQENK